MLHVKMQPGGLPFSTCAPKGEGGSSLLYISIAYNMQKKKGGEGVQMACKIAYVLNGRYPINFTVVVGCTPNRHHFLVILIQLLLKL